MAVLNIQITNAALPDIQGAIGSGLNDGGWISTAYLITEIVVIPLTGWLSRVFSVRRYLLANAVLFLVFSVLCATAHDLGQMIVLRALQGFTGGVLIPMAFTIIMTMLPAARQPVGMALFAVSATFAPAIGPTIGGWLNDTYGWQYIFYVNLVPGAVMLGMLWVSLDPAPMQLRLLRQGDWIGIASMAIGLGALQTVLEEGNKDDWFGSPFIVRLSAIAAIALTLFLVVEFRSRRPLLNLRLLLRRNFGFGTLANFLLGTALYGSVFILPLYLSQIQGYNAQQIGEVLAWTGLPQLVLIPLVPQLMKKYRRAAAGRHRLPAVRCQRVHEHASRQQFLRPAVPGPQYRPRDRPGAGADAAVRARHRRHRGGRRCRLGLGPVQHDAQPGRRDRDRHAADRVHLARAIPLKRTRRHMSRCSTKRPANGLPL